MAYGITDITNYVLFTNPLSRSMINGLHTFVTQTGIASGVSSAIIQQTHPPSPQVIVFPSLFKLAGGNSIFIRLAGVSGASAFLLQTYFLINPPQVTDPKIDTNYIFQVTNNMQIINTIALLAVPLTANPKYTGTLFSIGIALFCGSGYYQTFMAKQNKRLRFIASMGNFFLLLGWLSIIR